MLLLQKYKISGHSMEPILKDNDTILVSGLMYLFKKPKINDIVAFVYKDKVLVKRIVRKTNGKYFLAGDNSKDSLDSREFGFVFKNRILGKVIYKL